MELSKRQQRRQQIGAVVAHPAMAALTFERALEVFLAAQEGAGHSRETYRDYALALRLFWAHMARVHEYTAVQQVTEADIYGWLAHLRNTPSRRGQPYSSRSIQTYSRDVSVFFHWLAAHSYLAVNPMQQIKTPKVERPLIRVFTEEELQQLDAACSRPGRERRVTPDEGKALAARDRAILWVLLSTGIRRLELCRLRLADIDWEKGLLTILGKGAKGRKVPFGKVARQHLDTYLRYWRGELADGDEAVFLTVAGKSIHPHTVQALFARLKQMAGITDKRVSAHTCRHWFAVNCIKQGMPTAALRDLLGHENWDMIDVYVQLAEQDMRQLYMRYSPVDALEMHQTAKGTRQQIRAWRAMRKKRS
jgi:site-specific recombinase XerD